MKRTNTPTKASNTAAPFVVDGNTGVQSRKEELRSDLLFQRKILDTDLVNTTRWKVTNHLRTLIAELSPSVVGVYWPIKGEIDLRPFMHELHANGENVSLPRVPYKGHPLTYNIWEPGMSLDRDSTGVPCATGAQVMPAVMVIPMLGYSKQGYRLGYGGGYYDMSLKMMDLPALTIGVAYTAHEIEDFPSEYHDQKMDFVVTGRGVF